MILIAADANESGLVHEKEAAVDRVIPALEQVSQVLGVQAVQLLIQQHNGADAVKPQRPSSEAN